MPEPNGNQWLFNAFVAITLERCVGKLFPDDVYGRALLIASCVIYLVRWGVTLWRHKGVAT